MNKKCRLAWTICTAIFFICCIATDTNSRQVLGKRYNDAYFMATHNSYSGGRRGLLEEQLSLGVRFLELDIHNDRYDTLHDFEVGHASPCNGVALGGGNPSSARLKEWLGILEKWSRQNPRHGPLTVCIDVKDDLTGTHGKQDGNLKSLNEIIQNVFGKRLFKAEQVGEIWPTVEELRGRILIVLSGDEKSRLKYRQYNQVAFLEYQPGKDDLFLPDSNVHFYAIKAGSNHDISLWRQCGRIVRMWKFNNPKYIIGTQSPNLPATDAPFEAWYKEYTRKLNVVK